MLLVQGMLGPLRVAPQQLQDSMLRGHLQQLSTLQQQLVAVVEVVAAAAAVAVRVVVC
jgi:hypothetical protein